MNTYNIPRNVKGEGRILYIFSTKALIYTAIGLAIGLLFYFIFRLIGLKLNCWNYNISNIWGLGFVIATFKVPDSAF